MSPARPTPLLALLLLAAGCTLEPDYLGARCLAGGGCPLGFYCEPATSLCEPEPEVRPCTVNHGGCGEGAACTSVGPHVTCQCLEGLFGDGGVCLPDEAALGSLQLSYATGVTLASWSWYPLQPVFGHETFAYSAQVPATATRVALSASAMFTGASLTLDGEPMGSFFSYHEFPADTLPRTLTVEVTAPSGAQHRYTLAVTR